MRLPSRLWIASASLALALPASAQTELAKLHASDGAPTKYFGGSISASGGRALVGAVGDDTHGEWSGAAYLFDLTSGRQLAKLTAPVPAALDRFGGGVGIHGDRFIIGALGKRRVYVFQASTGALLHELQPSSTQSDDAFGANVALSGELAVVGAPFADAGGASKGEAYIYDLTTGKERFLLTASEGVNHTYFGREVAISGYRVLVSAPENGKGEAYLYDARTGAELFKLTASDEHPGARFGSSLAISGELAAIGASSHASSGAHAGAVYVFDARTGVELYKRTPADLEPHDLFGFEVSISGDRLLVTSRQDSDNGNKAGAVYMYELSTGVQLAKLVASDGSAEDYFGVGLASSGQRAILGAPGDDDDGPESGSAYLFDLPQETGTRYCFGDGSAGACPCGNTGTFGAGCAGSSGAGGQLVAAGSASVTADELVLHATGLPPVELAQLLVTTAELGSARALPFGDGLRCAGPGVMRSGLVIAGPSGDAIWGEGLGAVLGPWFAGDTRRFQAWYADPAGPCGGGYNTTNAVELVFSP